MTIDDAYRTLGISRGALQADAFAAYQVESTRLASAPEQGVAQLNRAYEVVTQDIWRQAQPVVDELPSDGEGSDTRRPPEPWEAVGPRPSSRRKVALLTVGLVLAALATGFVVAPLTGSEDDDGWSEEFMANALEGCSLGSGGLDAACRCITEELSTTLSEEEYVRLNYDILADGRPPDEYVTLATDCLSDPTP